MKILVIGLGSMGKRRIRLIKEMYHNYEVFGVDSRQDRRNEVTRLFNIETYSGLDDIKKDIDCAFVCTSPLYHSKLIEKCLNNSWHVFTEINLINDGYDTNIKLAQNKDRKLFLSSTFLYREEIKYIQKYVSFSKKWNYIYHVGQYLPDWHPWENYKDFFVGSKRTNGCRELLAIELPWLVKTFGKIKNANSVSDKISELKIDFHDNFMIQIEHENNNKGVLVVDVVSPCAVRNLEVYAEKNYISWNGTPDSIFEFDTADRKLKQVALTEKTEHQEGYSSFIVENAYKNEIKEFFNVVLHDKKPLYDFEQDKMILNFLDKIGA